METPENVIIRNRILGDKGINAVLVMIDAEAGYYDVKIEQRSGSHRALLPIASTVIVAREPEVEYEIDLEIER